VSGPDAGAGRFSGNEDPPLSCQEWASPLVGLGLGRKILPLWARASLSHPEARPVPVLFAADKQQPTASRVRNAHRLDRAATSSPRLRGLRGTAPEASLLFSRRFIAASGY